MPKFSKQSTARLATCHPDLQKLFNEVIKDFDCVIICGARTLEEQQAAFKGGFSKLDGINKKGKHQVSKDKPLSDAVDVCPFPIDWNNINRFKDLSKVVFKKAQELGLKITWGGSWKMKDYPHWER